jgi:hypothetical protein
MDRLQLLIESGHPVIYLVSPEERRALDCVARVLNRLRKKDVGKHLWRWSEGQGLERFEGLSRPEDVAAAGPWLEARGMGEHTRAVAPSGGQAAAADEALQRIVKAEEGMHPELERAIVVFFDLHPYLGADANGGVGPMVRPLRNTADCLRQYYDAHRGGSRAYQTIVVVAPTTVGRSIELNHEVVTIELPLPETDELYAVLKRMMDGDPLSFPSPIPAAEKAEITGPDAAEDEYCERLTELIAAAGRGLTLSAYTQGLNMIWVADRKLRPKHIQQMEQLKADTIKSPALEYTPRVEFKLGGLHTLKQWMSVRRGAATSRQVREKYFLRAPKGCMLVGAAGAGKSQSARLLAQTLNLALLRLDVASLFGSFVGESEQRARDALRLGESLAPLVLWIDEIDKAFAGAAEGNGGDNGVSARVFGYILTWLAEKQDDIFVVVTANNFDRVLGPFPEFGRKGRFDEIFWVGLPSAEARREIFEIYVRPHIKSGYLQVDHAHVERLKNAFDVQQSPAEGDPGERLLSLLASDRMSANMTGAEIEYAVTEALFEAYKRDQADKNGPAQNKFDAVLLGETVKMGRDRALYAGNALTALEALEERARANQWIFV